MDGRDRLTVLREAQAAASTVVIGLIPEGHRCGPISASKDQWEAMTAANRAVDEAADALMPTEMDAIRLLHDAYTRLKKLGWNDAIYCPKDGSEFDAIEVGSTGIHKTHYSGEWPDGRWWVAEAGDIWPSRPCLYRVSEEEKARWKGLGKKLRKIRDELREESPKVDTPSSDRAGGP